MPSPACNVAHDGHPQFLYNLGGRVVLLAITVTQNTIAPTAPRVGRTLGADSKPMVENTFHIGRRQQHLQSIITRSNCARTRPYFELRDGAG